MSSWSFGNILVFFIVTKETFPDLLDKSWGNSHIEFIYLVLSSVLKRIYLNSMRLLFCSLEEFVDLKWEANLTLRKALARPNTQLFFRNLYSEPPLGTNIAQNTTSWVLHVYIKKHLTFAFNISLIRVTN